MNIKTKYVLGINLVIRGATSQKTDKDGNTSNQNEAIFLVPFQG
jgi:hypothetical protein